MEIESSGDQRIRDLIHQELSGTNAPAAPTPPVSDNLPRPVERPQIEGPDPTEIATFHGSLDTIEQALGQEIQLDGEMEYSSPDAEPLRKLTRVVARDRRALGALRFMDRVRQNLATDPYSRVR